jgi:hypothetical protein
LTEPKANQPTAIPAARNECPVMNFAFVAGAFFNHSLSLLIVNKQLRLEGEPFCAAGRMTIRFH